MGPSIRFSVCFCVALLLCSGGEGQSVAISYIYTHAVQYDPQATLKGVERFPAGAALVLVANGFKRELVPGFAASADAAVSFDGRRVLFAGKRKASDPWQIWEMPLPGGAPRRITKEDEPEDSIAPFYLPDDRIVYAQRTPAGFQLMRLALAGGDPLQLTYGPGNHVASDVLADGRILFEAQQPGGARDIFTVYPDGTGVESYRCDHGPDRHGARELTSGDIVFETGGRLARFTSARAVQMEIAQPKGDIAGSIAEVSNGDWLVSMRSAASGPYALYRWRGGEPASLATQALQPVLVRPHAVPKRFPSAIRERPGANLLCLNVYTSRESVPAASVAAVRVWTLDSSGTPIPMGRAPVERDGSFYVQTPGETPIRFELLDRSGKTVAAEKGWFWARRGEQRVCVGCHAGPERAPENAVPETLLHGTEPAVMALPVHTARTPAPRPDPQVHGGAK
jgi:hypothetical protein